MATKKLKKPKVDMPKPAKPNKLYFYETEPRVEGAKKQYGWTLKSSNGKTIGTSSEQYSKKIYAIRNAITLFGKELWAGFHIVPDEADNALVLKEGVAQDEKRKAKEA